VFPFSNYQTTAKQLQNTWKKTTTKSDNTYNTTTKRLEYINEPTSS
jgi:hypothetical protein